MTQAKYYDTATSTWLPIGFGPQGYQGTQGYQGNQGNQGNQGSQGSQGNQGSQGAQGFVQIPYISGLWYPQKFTWNTTTAMVTGTPYAYPFVVTKSTSFSKIGLTLGSVASSFTGTGYMVYQVCNDNGSGVPSSLVAGTQCNATFSSAAPSGTQVNPSFSSPVTFAPGLYWLILVFQCSGSVTTPPSVRADNGGFALSPFGSPQMAGGTSYGSYSYSTAVNYSGGVVYPSAPPAGTTSLVAFSSSFIVGMLAT